MTYHKVLEPRRSELKAVIQLFFKTHKKRYYKIKYIIEWIGEEKCNRFEVIKILAELIQSNQLETIHRCNRLNYKWVTTC